MPPAALAQALLIAVIWGFNFVVIKVGVAGVPPLFLAMLRFVFCVFPAIFFVRKPDAPWLGLASYGIFLGVVEFGFLFTALHLGAPAGLSSLILQSQAFMTALIAAIVLRETIRGRNIAGMVIAGLGLALIMAGKQGTVSGSTRLTVPLFLMLMAAALGWAVANIIARAMPKAGGLALTVWSSLFSPIPLLGLSLWLEGPSAIRSSMASLTWLSVAALAYLVIMSTLIGYGLWNRLIMKHGASRIAPFSLLVPVFGLAATTLVLHERITIMDGAAAVLILIGLGVHALAGR